MRLRDLKKKFTQLFSLMFVLAGLTIMMQTPAVSADEDAGKPLAHVVTIEGVIGPPTLELVQRNIETAQKAHADVLIIVLSTPGGLFDSTQEIIKSILVSPVPDRMRPRRAPISSMAATSRPWRPRQTSARPRRCT